MKSQGPLAEMLVSIWFWTQGLKLQCLLAAFVSSKTLLNSIDGRKCRIMTSQASLLEQLNTNDVTSQVATTRFGKTEYYFPLKLCILPFAPPFNLATFWKRK